jgi:tRNA threonylcarbamoyl adenosine modification protein (Sua5/YciO/YrdC/YwlC family)
LNAVETLRAGRVVLLDTDTLPGLHALATLPAAAQSLRELKGSADQRPFLLLFPSLEAVLRHALPPREERLELLRRTWPAALTVLLSARAGAPPQWVAEGGSLAARVPGCAPLRALLEELDAPLFSTSVNRAGEAPATSLKEASERFPGLASFALGEASPGIASTLVDLRGDHSEVLRQGELLWPPPA